MKSFIFTIISTLISIAGADRPSETLAVVNTTDLLNKTLCTAPGLLGDYMCIMNDGTAPDRMYSNEVLMGGRNITNNTASAGYINNSNHTLRPDIIVRAQYTSKTIMNAVTTRADVYTDIFLCSEETCNNYVDIKYLRNGNLTGVGFMIGVVPFTELALGSPLNDTPSRVSDEEIRKPNAPEASHVTSIFKTVRLEANATDEKGYAILGTRVGFEAYSDYLLKNSSFGFASFAIYNGCSNILYPRNAWYHQNVISKLAKCENATQTFAMMGLSKNDSNWCRFCDVSSVDVINHHAACYLSDLDSCALNIAYPNVNLTVDNTIVRMYKLPTSSYDQQFTYVHPWSTLLMRIIAEARSPVPAGCNFQKSENRQCVHDLNDPTPCNFTPDGGYECSPAQSEREVPGDGYDALLRSLKNTWVASWQKNEFSMLGNERIEINYIQAEIDAAELWACQQASTSVVRSSAAFNPVFSAQGYMITFLINTTASVGAWLAYSEIATWVSRTLKRADSNATGKFIAGAVTMVITVLPFVVIVISDYSINKSNSNDTVYAQQAFDAPGYGKYKIVTVAQIDESAEFSTLPLTVGIPLIFATAAIGFSAIILTEVVKRRLKIGNSPSPNCQMSTCGQQVSAPGHQ